MNEPVLQTPTIRPGHLTFFEVDDGSYCPVCKKLDLISSWESEVIKRMERIEWLMTHVCRIKHTCIRKHQGRFLGI